MIGFLYYKLKETFNADLSSGDIPEEDIVFIEDTLELYSHGHYFGKDEYCVFDYDAISSGSGTKYVGNTDAMLKYIKFTSSGSDSIMNIISQLHSSVRNTTVYTGLVIDSRNESNVYGIVINITYTAQGLLYSAIKSEFSLDGVTESYKSVLDTLSGGNYSYIRGGEYVEITDSSVTAKSRSFTNGSNVPEDDLIITAATTTQAGVMTAEDKNNLDATTQALTWQTIE